MLDLIASKRAEIAAVCREFGVVRLDVFGSAATDHFDETSSDLDFLVAFSAGARERAFDNFFALKERLEVMFGRSVDLLTEPSIRNEILRKEIYEHRQMIYAA